MLNFIVLEILEPRTLLSTEENFGVREFEDFSLFYENRSFEATKEINLEVPEDTNNEDLTEIINEVTEEIALEIPVDTNVKLLSAVIDALLFIQLKKIYFYTFAPENSSFFLKGLGYSLEIILHQQFASQTSPYINYFSEIIVSNDIPIILEKILEKLVIETEEFIPKLELENLIDINEIKITNQEFYFITQILGEKTPRSIEVAYFVQNLVKISSVDILFLQEIFIDEFLLPLTQSTLETIEYFGEELIDYTLSKSIYLFLILESISWNQFFHEVNIFYENSSTFNIVVSSLSVPLLIDFYSLNNTCTEDTEEFNLNLKNKILYFIAIFNIHKQIVDHAGYEILRISSIFTPIIYDHIFHHSSDESIPSDQNYLCYYKKTVGYISSSTCTIFSGIGYFLFSELNSLNNSFSFNLENIYDSINDFYYLLSFLIAESLSLAKISLQLCFYCVESSVFATSAAFNYVIVPTIEHMSDLVKSFYSIILVPTTKYSLYIILEETENFIINFYEWWQDPSDFSEKAVKFIKKNTAKSILLLYELRVLSVGSQGFLNAFISSNLFIENNNLLILVVEKSALIAGKNFLDTLLAPDDL